MAVAFTAAGLCDVKRTPVPGARQAAWPGYRGEGAIRKPALNRFVQSSTRLAFIVFVLVAGFTSIGHAAPSACPEHYPGGVSPGIERPQLAAETYELCFREFAVIYSGISRTPLASAEHLTRARGSGRGLRREDVFHREERLARPTGAPRRPCPLRVRPRAHGALRRHVHAGHSPRASRWPTWCRRTPVRTAASGRVSRRPSVTSPCGRARFGSSAGDLPGREPAPA